METEKIEKYSETKEYSCSICDCTTYEERKHAVKCFNGHNVKPGSVFKEKCRHCGHDVEKTIPEQKTIEHFYYFCNICENQYDTKEEAEKCYDEHFVEGNCFSCNKETISMVNSDEYEEEDIVNAKTLYFSNEDDHREVPIMICFDCLKIAAKKYKKLGEKR